MLTNAYAQVTLPIAGMDRLQEALFQLVPYDASQGQEGVTAQGAILIGLLILVGLTSWKGIDRIHEGFNAWTWIAMGLVGLTLLTAAVGIPASRRRPGHTVHRAFLGVLIAILALCMADVQAPERRRAARLAVGVLALRQADLPAAGRRACSRSA